VEKGAIYIYGMHINAYKQGNQFNVEETRPRKLLLKLQEIKKITGRVAEKGLTIVPLRMYFSGNWAKLEIGIAKAKKTYEKRDVKKMKDLDKEAERDYKERG
jgi:SsrA-binding protein